MPIVDGLTSTKLIRSYEKTNPSSVLSPRARLNSRVPIIAVSASLIEKDRQVYIDAGFDAWILKPVSFPRLGELMKGIVDTDVRKSALYRPGHWETGGWFDLPKKEAESRASAGLQGMESHTPTSTSPIERGTDEKSPPNFASYVEDPFADATPAPKSKSMPHLRHGSDDEASDSGDPPRTIFPGDEVATPDAMS